MTRYEKILEVLEQQNTAEIVRLHNEYCDADNRMDDYVYDMSELDDILYGMKPTEIASLCTNGHEFNPNHDYFRFNGYGNLESFGTAPEGNSGIYLSEIADYVDRNEESFSNDEIQEVLDEVEGGEND